MHRGNIEFAALLAWISLAGDLAFAKDEANLPAPGSKTSDGFTVSALWHGHYTYQYASHGMYLSPDVFMNPCLNRGDRCAEFSTTSGDVDVTEEVNKQTGQLRAVVKSGNWRWEYHFRDRCHPNDYSASGEFDHSDISHWMQGGEAMVSFSVNPGKPANEEQLVKAGHLPNIGTLSCSVPFRTENVFYREKHGSPTGIIGGPPCSGNLQGSWESELIIRRSKQKIEAEIKPAPDYKTWVPTMYGAIPFEVRVVSPPGLPANWKISLYKVSKLPGVCGNAGMPQAVQAQWPGYHDGALPDGQQNQANKDPSYDLIFDFRKYGKTEQVFKRVDEPWQVLETDKPTKGCSFLVNCLDYGASGRVLAMATIQGETVAATYKETGETFVRIPYSKSKNDNHRIADAAKPDGVNTVYPADKPDEDKDDPNSRYPGDGLSVFEEYRGFVCKAGFAPGAGGFRHVRLDPQKRDLFVFTDGFSEELAPYLPAFAHASGLNVHWLGDDDDGFVRASDSSSRNHWVVNFNSDQAKKKPQHALNLLEDALEDAINGKTCLDANCRTTGVGPPKNIYWIKIDADKCRQIESNLPRMAGQLKRVVIHELGHGVGIYHHGDSNKEQNLIAVEGGQNSGDVNCAMKYVLWRFYRHNSRSSGPCPEPSPQLRIYDPDNKERPGFVFCTSQEGNDYNKVCTTGWQCGNAVRGNCLAQIRVNDASAASQAGKRATGKDVSDPGSDATMPPDDHVEQAARDSQKRAGVAFRLRLRDQQPIIPGEAIIMELSLRGTYSKEHAGEWDAPAPSSKALVQLGAADRPWTDQVHFLILDDQNKLVPLPAKYYPVGAARRVDSSGSHEHENPKIELKPDTTYLVAFAIDASQTEGWMPGNRRIFATIGSSAPGATDNTSSKSIILSVAQLPADERKSVPARRDLSQGYVELTAKHWTEAEKHARAAISEMLDSPKARLLLAESLEAQNKLREAYTAYNEALVRYKPAEGVAEPPEVIFAALKSLEEKLGIHPEPPQIGADPFAAHSLFGQSAGGKLQSPFAANASQLVFEWQLAEPSNDPLGVRWIAEEVSGVEKDLVITTAKSEPNKQSGQFSLTKPTAGFPTGKYRVEIWQGGKMIYSEEFEIKSQ